VSNAVYTIGDLLLWGGSLASVLGFGMMLLARLKQGHSEEGRMRTRAEWGSFYDLHKTPNPIYNWRLKRMLRKRASRLGIPSVALGLLATEDAERYEREWGAHLYQLIEEGEFRQARRDRRRLVLAAITLAIVLRVRRALSRAR